FDVRKIGLQRPHIVDAARSSKEDVLILLVKPSQRAHHVADVCAHAEVADTANVDRDLHGSSVTDTPLARTMRPISRPLYSVCWLAVPDRAETRHTARGPAGGYDPGSPRRRVAAALPRSRCRSAAFRALSCHGW